MDDSSSLPETITPRKASTASRRTTVSDSGTRKPASIYEINELYQALQDLVHSSPAPEIRRVRASGTNFDSSDSWTSGADSPDVRSRVPKKNAKVIRSSSNILARFSGGGTESPGLNRRVRTPELRNKLSHQRPPIGEKDMPPQRASPKLGLKKSKSDVSRVRSRSSVDGPKTMAEKIRDQRLKFTEGLRRKELEEEGCIIEGKQVKDIDDLLEWAKMSPELQKKGKKKKKKHGHRKRLGSKTDSKDLVRQHRSDSNLRSLDVTSRIDEWYEKAAATALDDIGDEDESFESYSGSESDDAARERKKARLKKGKSLGDIDLELDSLTADDLLQKWMGQKKNSLLMEERGRSSSDTSFEPETPEETDSSVQSISKENASSEKLEEVGGAWTSQIVPVSRIIVSQPSVEDKLSQSPNSDDNLPNQPIFYIPNISDGKQSKTTVIDEWNGEERDKLVLPSRPRSRSALSSRETFERNDEENWKEFQKMNEERSKSQGSVPRLHRRGSVETPKQERQERHLRTASEYRRSPRPRSLHLCTDLRETGIRGIGTKDHHGLNSLNSAASLQTDTNGNIRSKDKKGMKLSKLPGKLKNLLSGKKN